MATTVKQYVDAMRQRQDVVAAKMGVVLRGSSVEIRVLNLTVLALIGVVIKTLVDKGLVTDAEFLAVMNGAAADAWDVEPIQPPPM